MLRLDAAIPNCRISGAGTVLLPPSGPFTTALQEATMPSQITRCAAPGQSAICKQCRCEFKPRRTGPNVYCTINCKADWQRTQKPVDRDWLYEKYVVEGKSANQIAAIVRRHSKRVWEWLRDYGIPKRPRGHNYAFNRQFAFWIHGDDSPMKGHRHSAEVRAKLSQIAIADGRVPFHRHIGPPMKGKRGAETINWKGGSTPDRQAFYSSSGWKTVVKQVWRRDCATCQRCGRKNSGKERFAFDIHHIVSFACVELRAELSNLILLCERCHYWVHSNENTERLFIKEASQSVA